MLHAIRYYFVIICLIVKLYDVSRTYESPKKGRKYSYPEIWYVKVYIIFHSFQQLFKLCFCPKGSHYLSFMTIYWLLKEKNGQFLPIFISILKQFRHLDLSILSLFTNGLFVNLAICKFSVIQKFLLTSRFQHGRDYSGVLTLFILSVSFRNIRLN